MSLPQKETIERVEWCKMIGMEADHGKEPAIIVFFQADASVAGILTWSDPLLWHPFDGIILLTLCPLLIYPGLDLHGAVCQ